MCRGACPLCYYDAVDSEDTAGSRLLNQPQMSLLTPRRCTRLFVSNCSPSTRSPRMGATPTRRKWSSSSSSFLFTIAVLWLLAGVPFVARAFATASVFILQCRSSSSCAGRLFCPRRPNLAIPGKQWCLHGGWLPARRGGRFLLQHHPRAREVLEDTFLLAWRREDTTCMSTPMPTPSAPCSPQLPCAVP